MDGSASPDRTAPRLAATTAALVAGLGVLPLHAAAPDVQQRWQAAAACADRPDAPSRHECLDAVLREAGLLTPEMETRQQRGRFGLTDQPARRSAARELPPALPGPGAAPASSASAAPSPPPAPAEERLEVTLARAVTGPDRKLVLTTEDGAVWRQTSSAEVSPLPAAGDAMAVRKASMGSFICQVRDTLAFRCARSR